jgi:signal peptidase
MSPAEISAPAIRGPAEAAGVSVKVARSGSRGRAWASRVATVLLLFAGLSILAIGIGIRLFGLHLGPVLSNSMQPAFSAGDLVVTRAAPIDSLVAGQVIVFVPPGHDQPVAHRVVSIAGTTVTTRGDANPVDDPWQVQLSGTNVERVIATVPYLGWSSQLQRPLLVLALVLLGIGVLIGLWKEVGKRLRRA